VRVNQVLNQRKTSNAQGCQSSPSNRPEDRLVEDTEHDNHVGVLRLANEFGKDSNIVEGSLGVRVSHVAVQEGDGAFLPRVIESYTWERGDLSDIDIRSEPTRRGVMGKGGRTHHSENQAQRVDLSKP